MKKSNEMQPMKLKLHWSNDSQLLQLWSWYLFCTQSCWNLRSRLNCSFWLTLRFTTSLSFLALFIVLCVTLHNEHMYITWGLFDWLNPAISPHSGLTYFSYHLCLVRLASKDTFTALSQITLYARQTGGSSRGYRTT